MCGIIFTNQKYAKDYLEKTKYRGPDQTKLIQINNWYLGFNRLAFQDTSNAASQPMEFKNRYSFLFNGEIYNKDELKLSLDNVVLKSDSDTEILFLYLIQQIKENYLKIPLQLMNTLDFYINLILSQIYLLHIMMKLILSILMT